MGAHAAVLPADTLRLALDIHRGDFLLKFGDAVTDLASIQFSVRLAAPPATDAASGALHAVTIPLDLFEYLFEFIKGQGARAALVP